MPVRKLPQNETHWLDVLLSTLLLYIGLSISNSDLFIASLEHFFELIKTIVPILLVVMLCMWILDVLVSSAMIKK